MATLPESRLHQSLSEITRLLDRHRVLEALAHQQERPKRDLVEQLQHRQNLAELGKRLGVMHAADIAHVLESLPLGDRMTVWREVSQEQAGDVFVEVSEAVRESLIEGRDETALVEMLTRLDPEDLAYVSASLADKMRIRVEQRLEQSERTIFEDSIRFPRSSVGYVMTREWVEVSDRHTVGDTLADLRRLAAMPPQTDHLYVVDVRHVLRGIVPVPVLLVSASLNCALSVGVSELTRLASAGWIRIGTFGAEEPVTLVAVCALKAAARLPAAVPATVVAASRTLLLTGWA